ncbi:MAG: SIS domain-containing protein [Patescibacteria group bacterium]
MASGFEKNALAFHTQLSLRAVTPADLQKLKKIKKPDAIVGVGMGGSGLAATILQNLRNDVNIPAPVIPWKNFGLPEVSYAKNPFYLFTSFSGDTKETLDGFRSVIKNPRAAVGVIASGGELLRVAIKKGIPRVSFSPGDFAPRQTTGILTYGCLAILKAIWPMVIAPDLSKKVNPESLRREAERIAGAIGKNNAVVFAESTDSHLAYFWKAHLNETGKTFTSWNVLPEMNHNEIVGFEGQPKDLTAIFLEGNPKDTRAKSIREVTAGLIEASGTKTVTVSAVGTDRFERTMQSLALGMLVAIEVAKIKNVDPQETNIIQEIKKKISKFR